MEEVLQNSVILDLTCIFYLNVFYRPSFMGAIH